MTSPGPSRTLALTALLLLSLLGFTAESERAGTASARATGTSATEETAPGQISSRAPPFPHSLTKPAVSEPRETQPAVSTQAYRVPTVTSGDISAESIPEAFEYSSREEVTEQELPHAAEPLTQPVEEPPALQPASLASSVAEEASYSKKLTAAPPKTEEEGRPQEPSYTETFEAPLTLTEPEEAETSQEAQERDETRHDAHFDSPPPSVHDSSPPPSIHDASPPPSLRDEEEQPVFELGQRVLIGSVMAGSVRYIGHTHFAEGLWVGVELDLPKGINDGSKDDHRYFSCEPDHGLFAPPSKVSLLEEEEEEEEEASEGEGSVEEEIESSVDKSGDQFWEEGVATAEGGDDPAEAREPRDSYTPDFELSDKEEPTAEQALPSDKAATHEHASVQDFEGNIAEQLPVRDEDHPITKATELQLPALSGDVAEDSSVIPLVAPEEEAPASQSPVLPIVPAFAPPPEFAGGASRESSEEREASPPLLKNTETVVSELTQDLSNEAFETVHRIWRNKHVGKRSSSEVVVYKDKDIPLTLEEKADKITDELLALLLQSETSLVCNIHSAKTSHPPEPVDTAEARLPKHREPPAKLVIPVFNIESSPPPISPPLIFQGSPPPAEFSPPGSPPRHLSQASAARVAAGDKSPFLAVQQEPGSPPHSRKASMVPRLLERSSSLETITELMESVKFKTSQSMVPNERQHVDRVVEEAWNAVKNVGLDCLHSTTFQCPREVLSLFRDSREYNPTEDKCRVAYLQLVYMLSIQTLRELYPPSTPRQVWAHPCAVGGTLTRRRSRDEATTLEQVQKKVFATLMKGQLPPQLPAVKFLHGMKVGDSLFLSPLSSHLSYPPPLPPLETWRQRD